MPVSLGTGTGRDPGLTHSLWTLEQELLSPGPGEEKPQGEKFTTNACK